MGKVGPFAHLKVYEVTMPKYGKNDKPLLQTFPISLIRAALTWFTKSNITRNTKWINLDHLFVDQYKFNSEIAPDENNYKE